MVENCSRTTGRPDAINSAPIERYMLRSWDGRDRLQNAAGDLVRVSGGVRTTVFQVATVGVLWEAVRHADGGSAVGHAVVEFVDGLGLVETGQTEVIVRTVHSNVLVVVLSESRHQGLEVFLSTNFAHVLSGEVGVHAGTVPVTEYRLAVEIHVYFVFFAEANENVAGHPHFVSGALGAFAEDLEFPLALGDLGIDAFVVDPGVVADVEMFFDDFASDATDVAVADTSIVGALWSGIAGFREAKRAAILVQEVFLFEAEPGIGVVQNGGASVGGMGCAISQVDFAHHKHAVFAGAIGEHGNGLQHAIRVVPLGLPGRTTVESPVWKFFQLGEVIVLLDEGLTPEVGHGGVAVEPDVFQLVFRHVFVWMEFDLDARPQDAKQNPYLLRRKEKQPGCHGGSKNRRVTTKPRLIRLFYLLFAGRLNWF